MWRGGDPGGGPERSAGPAGTRTQRLERERPGEAEAAAPRWSTATAPRDQSVGVSSGVLAGLFVCLSVSGSRLRVVLAHGTRARVCPRAPMRASTGSPYAPVVDVCARRERARRGPVGKQRRPRTAGAAPSSGSSAPIAGQRGAGAGRARGRSHRPDAPTRAKELIAQRRVRVARRADPRRSRAARVEAIGHFLDDVGRGLPRALGADRTDQATRTFSRRERAAACSSRSTKMTKASRLRRFTVAGARPRRQPRSRWTAVGRVWPPAHFTQALQALAQFPALSRAQRHRAPQDASTVKVRRQLRVIFLDGQELKTHPDAALTEGGGC